MLKTVEINHLSLKFGTKTGLLNVGIGLEVSFDQLHILKATPVLANFMLEIKTRKNVIIAQANSTYVLTNFDQQLNIKFKPNIWGIDTELRNFWTENQPYDEDDGSDDDAADDDGEDAAEEVRALLIRVRRVAGGDFEAVGDVNIIASVEWDGVVVMTWKCGQVEMSDSTSRECLYNFCKNIRRLYGPKYSRKPNYNDVINLYEHHENYHGFPGMLGSIDCMHWDWENCPVAWRGQFMRGDHGCPSIILEAVASQDLWIWHAYFGMLGANNNLNVLNSSPLLNGMENGVFPQSSFFCNDNEYAHGYYLADGIYPK
ncbi:hypothetical protein E3N88_28984 [Mikania micrantha]|uniref:Uncharacterized protein n=1 Tax=Mikania micrantha TaxID=192012 RepID=A0A5N6N114_9ASTR|nr:hypothetical protein E3N88_28984 [Mikania micrantha]